MLLKIVLLISVTVIVAKKYSSNDDFIKKINKKATTWNVSFIIFYNIIKYF